MARLIASFLLLVASLATQAQDTDPMASASCRAAREALDNLLDDPALGRNERAHRLALARKRASDACLGRASGKPERAGAPQPAQAVPAPGIAAAPGPKAVARAARPLPALVIPRPATVTACDPAGCWDSEGRRLNQAGPMLMGPRGVCTLQGGVVNCP